MASLALGVAGAAIGSFFGPLGASVGWALGAGVGNWLTGGGKNQDGPKLSDLKLQNSSYAMPIPVGYGTKRIAGNIIDQSDLEPHEETSGGGKGGGSRGSTTTTTYTASLMVLLSETSYIDGNGALVNRPIKMIHRIWANGRLIWGAGSSGTTVPITIYYGDEEQLPDPTFEALRGAGNVPGYRGRALVVFTDMEMGPFGNALPNFEFEVQFDGDVLLEYYSIWPVDYDYVLNGSAYSYPSLLNGVDSSVAGQITMHRYRSGNNYGAEMGTGDDSTVYYESKTYDYQGTLLSQTTPTSFVVPNADFFTNASVLGSSNSGHAYVVYHFTYNCPDKSPPATELDTFAWLKDGEITFSPDILLLCNAAQPFTVGLSTTWSGDLSLGAIYHLVYWNGNLYGLGSDAVDALWIRRWPAPDGSCYTRDYDAEFDLTPYTRDTGFGVFGVGTINIGNDGYLYCDVSYNGGAFPEPDVLGLWGNKLVKLDADLNLIADWYDPSSFGPISEDIGTPIEGAVAWNGYWIKYRSSGEIQSGDANYRMYQLNSDGTLTFITELNALDICNGDSPPACNPISPLVLLEGTNLAAFRGGLITLGGNFTTLGAIVEDVSKQVGYTSTQYDVSQLTDLVRGYAIADRMTGRAAIDALRPVYQFGAVESNFAVKFRKWTGEVDATISEDDLGCIDVAGERVDTDLQTRALESELPQSTDLLYHNYDMDYQEGHDIRQRQVTESELHVAIAAPVVLTPSEAAAANQMILLNAWVERNKHTIQLPRKWSHLEPTDVIALRDVACRLVNKDEQDYTHIVFNGVEAVTSVFVTAPLPTAPGGFVPQPVPSPNNTDTVLLDAPLISDTDSEVGFYVAMAGRRSGTWPQATLFKSIDGGSEYNSVASSADASSIGRALTTLGDFDGGNVFDEVNTVRVRITPGSPALSSTTETGVLNGANMCALGDPDTGWEILQYRDADLVSERVYDLSGLLRGRRGSEQFMGTHLPDDVFVALPVTNVLGSGAELGAERLYKGITAGRTLSSESAIEFTNTGVALKPYAPVQLGGGRDGSGNLTLTWVRRTRIGGAWTDNVDVPLSEAFEKYNVIVYDDNTYSNFVRSWIVEDATEQVYLAVDQSSDFGSPQATVYFEVGQLGSYGEGYYAQGSA